VPTFADEKADLAKTPLNTEQGDYISQFAAIAYFVYGHIPHRVCSLNAGRHPVIDSIKAIRTTIPPQHSQMGISEA
jgi:hypothetical protein